MHPILVHVPIGVLAVAPLLMLIGLLPIKRVAGIRWAALILLVVGVGTLVVAKESGEATAEYTEPGMIDGAGDVVELHEKLAERSVIAFAALAALYGATLGVQHFWTKSRGVVPHVVVHGVLLLGTGAALVLLANAGHAGGRLVHQFGVRAPIAETTASASAADATPTTKPAADGDGDNH
jgi:uncharacterized membrane protein